jgi:SepF-like predicted cell division protein (DUF552 family)
MLVVQVITDKTRDHTKFEAILDDFRRVVLFVQPNVGQPLDNFFVSTSLEIKIIKKE